MRFTAAVLGFLLFLMPAIAAAEDDHPQPFDGNYDAMPVVDAALARARAEDKRLLLVLGANWCHDSRGLAHHFEDAELAATLEQSYVTRFIDVDWRNENQDVAARFGIAALYATPTVLIVDPEEEVLLNREARNDWSSAASTPVEEARAWFAKWADQGPASAGLLEGSLTYQAMLLEIEVFEDEEAARLAGAYRDIAAWRALPVSERPENFAALDGEVEAWRRALPRQISRLQSRARSLVAEALSERAGDGTVTIETVAALDADEPDLALDFEPHVSSAW